MIVPTFSHQKNKARGGGRGRGVGPGAGIFEMQDILASVGGGQQACCEPAAAGAPCPVCMHAC